jgi:hypothetical protein
MNLIVQVTNAVWACDGADPDDGEHFEEFTALIQFPDDFDFSDPLVVDEYVHDFLINKCECCIVEGDFDWSHDVQRYR